MTPRMSAAHLLSRLQKAQASPQTIKVVFADEEGTTRIGVVQSIHADNDLVILQYEAPGIPRIVSTVFHLGPLYFSPAAAVTPQIQHYGLFLSEHADRIIAIVDEGSRREKDTRLPAFLERKA